MEACWERQAVWQVGTQGGIVHSAGSRCLPSVFSQGSKAGLQLHSRCATCVTDIINFVTRKARSAVKRLSGAARSQRAPELIVELERYFDVSDIPQNEMNLMVERLRDWKNYVPPPYSGCVTLFRPQVRPLLDAHSIDLGWGKIARGGLQIIPLWGNHFSVSEEANLNTLAAALSAALDQSKGRDTATRGSN
jgi:thioesterase domain-containing protein